MTTCKPPGGDAYYTAGACKPGETTIVASDSNAAPGGSTSVPSQSNSQSQAWMPKLPATIKQTGEVPAEYRPMTPSSPADKSGSTYFQAMSSENANAMYMMFPQYESLFTSIAKAQGGRSGPAAFDRFVSMSSVLYASGIKKTPFQLAEEYAAQHGIKAGSGMAGPAGPAAPVPLDSSSVRRAMDSVSTSLVGRTLSDDEFKDYYKSYTGKFAGTPDIDMQQHAIDAVKQDEGYQEYQVAEKFAQVFQSTLKGAM